MSEELEDIKGVGPATADRLKRAGFTTLEAIAVTPIRELVAKAGLSYDAAIKISNTARSHIGLEFITAKEVWERRKTMTRCSTGSRELDRILGGGVETQAITEFIGEYGVGKTQLCLKLSVMAHLPRSDGGLEGRTLYIDSEGTFSPERVYQISMSMGLDPSKVLDNIIVARAYNSDHQSLIIDHLFEICPKENVKLVVVDSMISHFRGEYVGRENLSERQQKLNECLHKLLRLAEAYNLAVIITNQVQANPAVFFGDPNKPAGGHIMAHASTHRIYIRRSKENTRVAKVIDSSYLPESEARFIISEKGIEDIKSVEDEG
ncbi:MAG: DNA repair and recombination protein RadA [Candidatus Bathyarchaeia archaeon]